MQASFFFLSLFLNKSVSLLDLNPNSKSPHEKGNQWEHSHMDLTKGIRMPYKTASHWSFLCFLLISSFYILTSLDINKCFTSVGLKPANKPLLLLKQLVGGTKPLLRVQPLHRTVLWAAHGPDSETHSSSLRNSPSKGLPCIESTALHGKHQQHPNFPSLLQKAALLN